MLALFIGGIKSGKSKNAEKYTLANSKNKPVYLATNEFFDEEMQKKVAHHKHQREEKFHTLEEPLNLTNAITQTNTTVLVECVSMWINNMLYHKRTEAQMIEELHKVIALEKDIVWVINEVGNSVVSENELVRKFVEINGRIAQFLAIECKEVYNTTAGISVKIK